MWQVSAAVSSLLSQIRGIGGPPADEAAEDRSECTYHSAPWATPAPYLEGAAQDEARRFRADFEHRERRIHRFPATLRCMGPQYIAPKIVAIGPYYHGVKHPHLQEMEKVKRVAASCFVSLSGRSYDEFYPVMSSVARDARLLYDSDSVEGMTDDEFTTMMFRDACFLATYMIWYVNPYELGLPSDPPYFSSELGLNHVYSSNHLGSPWDHVYAFNELGSALERVYFSNRDCIDNDVMLLENQLPWVVLRELMTFKEINVGQFIARMGESCQIRLDRTMPRVSDVIHDNNYGHLLAILRFHKTGTHDPFTQTHTNVQDSTSTTVSAIELAEMGIKLAASRTEKFVDMHIKNGPLSGELILAPLLLDIVSASWLVNMAAFEVCTATSPGRDDNKTIVRAYLSVLGMLMDREEDAHQLRTKRLLQGRFTNKEALDFFKAVTQKLPIGPSLYDGVMLQIESYRQKRWIRIKVHKFFYNKMKTIITVLTVIGFLVALVNVINPIYKRSK